MKKCPSCGRTYSDLVQVCPACNASLSGGTAPSSPAPQRTYTPPQQPVQKPQPTYTPPQPTFTPPVQQSYTAPAQEDKAGIGWVILSFVFPIVGIILHFKWKNDRPDAAKTVSKAAIAGILLNVFLGAVIPTFQNNEPDPVTYREPVMEQPAQTPYPASGSTSSGSAQYAALFSDRGITEIPANFNYPYTASYGRVIEDNMVETFRVSYSKDMVMELDNALYVPLGGLDQASRDLLVGSIKESLDPVDNMNYIDVEYYTAENAFAAVITVSSAANNAAVREIAQAGLLTISDLNADYISFASVDASLPSSGYIK